MIEAKIRNFAYHIKEEHSSNEDKGIPLQCGIKWGIKKKGI